jgi:hypothetical protein
MAEPSETRVRPIAMKRAAVVAAVLLVLTGCGSTEKGSTDKTSGEDQQHGSAMVGDCSATSDQVTGAKTLVSADLDGDGTPEAVKLTRPGGDCSSTLFAKLGEGYVATVVPVDPPATSAFAVVPKSGGQLVVTEADHPRGGYQLRVYAAGTDKLVELQSDSQPLLPFVALDVKEHPWSIECSADGLVFTEAVAHEPVGVAAAWDIKQTAYTLDGTTLTRGATKEIADNVLPQDLDAKYPDLAKHSAFESCRAS